MTRHIAIVAYGPSMHEYVNLAKAVGDRRRLCDETWGVNAVASVLDCDLGFHMDDVRIQQIRAAADPDSNIAAMLGWLKTTRTPVYTSRVHEDYPALVDFPLERVLNATGGIAYFNSTPAYAIGLALAEYGRDLVLSLWGLDYTYANAHHAEKGRACIEFWVGRAIAMGVDVRIPAGSSLLDSCEPAALYGYGRFGSITPKIEQTEAGGLAVTMAENAALPSADEIERAYDHTRHPSPLVSGVTQQKE